MNINDDGDILNPEMLWNCFIIQNRRRTLDYKARESWLFFNIRLIWGIFIFVHMRT